MDSCFIFLSFVFVIVERLCLVVLDVLMQGRCSTLLDILRMITCKAEDWSNIVPVSVPLTTRLLLGPSSQLAEKEAPTGLVSSCSIYFAIILRSTHPCTTPLSLPQPSSIILSSIPDSKSRPRGKRPKRGESTITWTTSYLALRNERRGLLCRATLSGSRAVERLNAQGQGALNLGNRQSQPRRERTRRGQIQLGGSHRVRSLSCREPLDSPPGNSRTAKGVLVLYIPERNLDPNMQTGNLANTL